MHHYVLWYPAGGYLQRNGNLITGIHRDVPSVADICYVRCIDQSILPTRNPRLACGIREGDMCESGQEHDESVRR